VGVAEIYVWTIRSPDGASLGLEFAHCLMDPCDRVLAHALPERADVEVRDENGNRVAKGAGLAGESPAPMSSLTIVDGDVRRENVWPTSEDLGVPVILAGGEVGLLERWWHADDRSEWRWSVEFYNRRGGHSSHSH
jgi:hypothetical protein